ncbi:MAG: hypothetical protein RXO28_04215 [Thermocladium sp.]
MISRVVMDPLLALIPASGAVLMAYYARQTMRRINACLPGVFHCEVFNFIVPRRTRLLLSIGASITLSLLAILIIMNYAALALVISIMGVGIGIYGIILQVKHGAYCMYCLTTDAILLITAIMMAMSVL